MAISGQTEEESLGKTLIARGWKMGVLVPPMLRGVVTSNEDTGADTIASLPLIDGSPRQSLAVRWSGKPKSRLVICSQTCDIASDEESSVEAMHAEEIGNADAFVRLRQSSRRFVLDPTRRLIANCAIRTILDKRLLLNISPESGCENDENARNFALWIASRYARGAHPDSFVEGVIRPILGTIGSLRSRGDERIVALDKCRGFRVFAPSPNDSAPFDVAIYFVLPDDAEANPKYRAELAALAPDLQSSLSPTVCSSFSWFAETISLMSARDFLDTDEILL